MEDFFASYRQQTAKNTFLLRWDREEGREMEQKRGGEEIQKEEIGRQKEEAYNNLR